MSLESFLNATSSHARRTICSPDEVSPDTTPDDTISHARRTICSPDGVSPDTTPDDTI